MQTHRCVSLVIIGMLVAAICGCSMVNRRSLAGDMPYFIADPSDSKALQTVGQRHDRLLKSCMKPLPCDHLLYTRGLAALFETRARATTTFQELIASTPASALATVSAQWLALLQDDASLSDPTHALLGQYVTRELLERDTPSAQSRIKAQEKRIEELTRQLDLLKQIEQQRSVRDLPTRRVPATVAPE